MNHHTKSITLAVMLSAHSLASIAGGATIFVRANATPPGNGDTWATAYADLQLAISEAAGTPTTADEIWVAAGTYKPNPCNPSDPCTVDDRNSNFMLQNKIAIYGGFAGTETVLSQRAFGCLGGTNDGWICMSGTDCPGGSCPNPTILSGDLLGNDVTPGFGNRADNSNNIVNVISTEVDTAILDGFTVRGGDDTVPGGLPAPGGGGIRLATSSSTIELKATIKNVIITDNRTLSGGGGVYNFNSKGARYVNCIIKGNKAEHGGGVGGKQVGSPQFINCQIVENIATSGGGCWFEAGSGGTPTRASAH